MARVPEFSVIQVVANVDPGAAMWSTLTWAPASDKERNPSFALCGRGTNGREIWRCGTERIVDWQ